MLCVLSLAGRIDEARLVRAVRLTLDAEPILGCRFVGHWFRPYWQRYDDLDSMRFCEVRASADCQADMYHFIEAPIDCTLRVLLLRGDSEMLCIKLDHRAGDGRALLEYAYLLAHIYNCLGDNPAYVPIPNVNYSRSMMQVGNQFDLPEKWRIFRHILKQYKDMGRLGQWHYPTPRDKPLEFDYVAWRMEADHVNAIFKYAWRRRATVSQVLLAAFYLAACEAMPHSTDRPLPLNIAVDLRRYLPSTTASALCNLVGNSVIAVDPRSGTSIDAVVQQIQDQMRSQRKYLGLAASFFAFEALPLIRHLVGLVPHSHVERSNRRRRERPRTTSHVPGIVLLTEMKLDPDRLVFSGTKLIDAFACGGGSSKVPGVLALGVSGFRGSLTMTLGAGPTPLVTRVFERMMQLLPARPASPPTPDGS